LEIPKFGGALGKPLSGAKSKDSAHKGQL